MSPGPAQVASTAFGDDGVAQNVLSQITLSAQSYLTSQWSTLTLPLPWNTYWQASSTSARSLGVIPEVFAYVDIVLLMQALVLPVLKLRLPLALASATNVVHRAIRWALQAALSLTQRSVT